MSHRHHSGPPDPRPWWSRPINIVLLTLLTGTFLLIGSLLYRIQQALNPG